MWVQLAAYLDESLVFASTPQIVQWKLDQRTSELLFTGVSSVITQYHPGPTWSVVSSPDWFWVLAQILIQVVNQWGDWFTVDSSDPAASLT